MIRDTTSIISAQAEETILEARGIVKSFQKVLALDDVSFDIRRGAIKALIGPNGAGKTTMLNVISGFLRRDKGRINFDGRNITGLRSDRIASQGIARTFQLVRLFSVHGATVLDNVMMGAYRAIRPSILKAIFLRQRMARKEGKFERLRVRNLSLWASKGRKGSPLLPFPSENS